MPYASCSGERRRSCCDRPLWELAHPADRENERETVRRLLRDRPLFDQSEKRFMRQDGEVVHAIVSVSLTADGHDRPQGYIWQLVDVTEQRRAEARAGGARGGRGRGQPRSGSSSR